MGARGRRAQGEDGRRDASLEERHRRRRRRRVEEKGDALADAAETEDAFDFLDADEIEDAEERLLAAAEAEAASDDASDASDEAASSSFFGGKGKKDAKALKKYKEQISALAGKRADAESAYVKAVAAALPAHKRGRLAKLLSDPRTAPGWEGDRDALALPSSKMARRGKPHAFVLTFNGDVRASAPGRGAPRGGHRGAPVGEEGAGRRGGVDPEHGRRDGDGVRSRRGSADAHPGRGAQAHRVRRAGGGERRVHDGVRRGQARRLAVRGAGLHRGHLRGPERVRAVAARGDPVRDGDGG